MNYTHDKLMYKHKGQFFPKLFAGGGRERESDLLPLVMMALVAGGTLN